MRLAVTYAALLGAIVQPPAVVEAARAPDRSASDEPLPAGAVPWVRATSPEGRRRSESALLEELRRSGAPSAHRAAVHRELKVRVASRLRDKGVRSDLGATLERLHDLERRIEAADALRRHGIAVDWRRHSLPALDVLRARAEAASADGDDVLGPGSASTTSGSHSLPLSRSAAARGRARGTRWSLGADPDGVLPPGGRLPRFALSSPGGDPDGPLPPSTRLHRAPPAADGPLEGDLPLEPSL